MHLYLDCMVFILLLLVWVLCFMAWCAMLGDVRVFPFVFGLILLV